LIFKNGFIGEKREKREERRERERGRRELTCLSKDEDGEEGASRDINASELDRHTIGEKGNDWDIGSSISSIEIINKTH